MFTSSYIDGSKGLTIQQFSGLLDKYCLNDLDVHPRLNV